MALHDFHDVLEVLGGHASLGTRHKRLEFLISIVSRAGGGTAGVGLDESAVGEVLPSGSIKQII